MSLPDRLLRDDRHSVFLDFDPEQGIVAGQSWEQTLYRKLRSCRAVIALCTDDYLSSQWCFAEIALARMEGKLLDRGAPGLIMILGSSGSGKSSLVRAGMIPRLRRETDRWLVVDPFRPERDPIAALAESLASRPPTLRAGRCNPRGIGRSDSPPPAGRARSRSRERRRRRRRRQPGGARAPCLARRATAEPPGEDRRAAPEPPEDAGARRPAAEQPTRPPGCGTSRLATLRARRRPRHCGSAAGSPRR